MTQSGSLKTRIKDMIEQRGSGKVAFKMIDTYSKGVSARISSEYVKGIRNLDVFPYYLRIDRIEGGTYDNYKNETNIFAGKLKDGEISTSVQMTDGFYNNSSNYYGFRNVNILKEIVDRFRYEGYKVSADEIDEIVEKQEVENSSTLSERLKNKVDLISSRSDDNYELSARDEWRYTHGGID